MPPKILFLLSFLFLAVSLVPAQEPPLSADAQAQETLVQRIESLSQAPGSQDPDLKSAVSDLESRQFVVTGQAVKVTSAAFNEASKVWTFRVKSLAKELPFESTIDLQLKQLGLVAQSKSRLRESLRDGLLVGTIRYKVVRVPAEGRYYLRVTSFELVDGGTEKLSASRDLDQRVAIFVPGHRAEVKTYYEVGAAGPDGGVIFAVKGEQNSEVMTLDTGTLNWPQALQACAAFSSDDGVEWRLPAKEELDQIYSNVRKKGLGNFTRDYYWSATEEDSLHVWYQNFRTGEQYRNDKADYALVCVVRVF